MATHAQQGQKDFADYLARHSVLDRVSLERAKSAARSSSQPISAALIHLGLLTDERCRDLLADHEGLATISYEALPATQIEPDLLPLRFLRDRHVLILAAKADVVRIALTDPGDSFTLQAIRMAAKRPIETVLATQAHLDRRLQEYGQEEEQEEAQEAALTVSADPADLGRLRDLASEAPIVRRVNTLIAQAAERAASDIHLEPRRTGLGVRYRIDGALVAEPLIPSADAPAILSRIKLLAGLNIAEQRLPQDGRLRQMVRGRAVDIRVATLPSVMGESLVMRLLDQAAVALDLEALGFAGEALDTLKAELMRPNGIMLVTGPTGSGKTTTLYAALQEIHRPGIKIMTVEDPVEYELDGLVQTQVHPAIGLDFAAVLRATLRHNPNVILVGEIRDGETARIAVEAALTGHLVLATLHTNSAAGSIARLMDMGVEDFLLASTLSASIGQRLVRCLCDACKTAKRVPADLLRRHGAPEEMLSTKTVRVYQPVGCEACNHTGYRGRTIVHEMLVVDEAVRKHIYARADVQNIANAAAYPSLRQHGLTRVLAGEVALEDVLFATREG